MTNKRRIIEYTFPNGDVRWFIQKKRLFRWIDLDSYMGISGRRYYDTYEKAKIAFDKSTNAPNEKIVYGG